MARKRNLIQAVGYVRTSSAANVGHDKDSEPRQRRAIERFAKSPAVSGADPIESRPGFAALLNRIDGNGVRIVLVEDATRSARDLMAQELGTRATLRITAAYSNANIRTPLPCGDGHALARNNLNIGAGYQFAATKDRRRRSRQPVLFRGQSNKPLLPSTP